MSRIQSWRRWVLIGAASLFALVGCDDKEIELRLASNAPAPNLTKMRVKGSKSPIFVDAEAIITKVDIAEMSQLDAPPSSAKLFHIKLTPAGTKKLAAATRKHIGKPMAVMVDGKIVSTPVVREAIESGMVRIKLD